MTPDLKTRWMATLAVTLSAAALATALASGCRTHASDATAPTEIVERAYRANAISPPSTTPASPSTSLVSSTPAVAPPSASTAVNAPTSKPAPLIAAPNVKRLVVTHGVEAREPLATDGLTAGDPVFAFLELNNGHNPASAIVITFEREDATVGHVELDVPADAQRWRTWGRTAMIRQAGTWTAVVRTKDGRELARQSFEVGRV